MKTLSNEDKNNLKNIREFCVDMAVQINIHRDMSSTEMILKDAEAILQFVLGDYNE